MYEAASSPVMTRQGIRISSSRSAKLWELLARISSHKARSQFSACSGLVYPSQTSAVILEGSCQAERAKSSPHERILRATSGPIRCICGVLARKLTRLNELP